VHTQHHYVGGGPEFERSFVYQLNGCRAGSGAMSRGCMETGIGATEHGYPNAVNIDLRWLTRFLEIPASSCVNNPPGVQSVDCLNQAVFPVVHNVVIRQADYASRSEHAQS
jgi:hypothetical protein